jgi:hypothetical protein
VPRRRRRHRHAMSEPVRYVARWLRMFFSSSTTSTLAMQKLSLLR